MREASAGIQSVRRGITSVQSAVVTDLPVTLGLVFSTDQVVTSDLLVTFHVVRISCQT